MSALQPPRAHAPDQRAVGAGGASPGGVSAVVVNYRSTALTIACVASLRAEGVGEIVVVDSGSGAAASGAAAAGAAAAGAAGSGRGFGDDCGATLAAADPDARFVALARNRGYGAAANAGVGLTHGWAVLVCNPDLTVGTGTVAALAGALSGDPAVAIVGPRIDRPDGTRYPSARTFPSLADAVGHGALGLLTTSNRWSTRYLRADAAGPGPVDWVSGACFMARRSAWDAVAGFDESFFMFMEDVDLCWRLHRRGWGVAYEPAGRVVHLEGASRRHAPYAMILAHHRSLLRYGWRTGGLRGRVLLPLVGVGIVARALVLCVRTAAQRSRR